MRKIEFAAEIVAPTILHGIFKKNTGATLGPKILFIIIIVIIIFSISVSTVIKGDWRAFQKRSQSQLRTGLPKRIRIQ